MLTPTNSLMPLGIETPATTGAPPLDEEGMKKAAQEFEASYIAQMLTFSGLDKALMAGGGDDMAAFTSFYIQSFAEDIAENGGFGLAEKFYDRMVKISGADSAAELGGENVDFGKL